jgi:hypothetical protein
VRRISLAGVALIAALALPASAQSTAEGIPESLTLFYDALSAAPRKDVPGLIRRATASDWVSCGCNDICGAREQVIAAIAARHASIPDLKWTIRDVLVSGNRVVVRGEATGTPAGDFNGVPYGGKSFRIMSIDVHTMEAGRIARSYHVEDWIGAVRQLSAK